MKGQWLSKIQQSGGKCFKFVSTCHAISKSKNLACIFFCSGKFIQKVLWEENFCEEGICRTRFLRKEMRNSELLQVIDDLL